MLRPALAIACVLAGLGGLFRPAHAGEIPRTIGLHPPSGPALAMLDSKIDVTVRGPIVEAVITQRFQNRTDHATEATYIFPLPHDAAVTAMTIKSGNRTYRAAIAKREDAQRRYEEAIRAGVAGALLDQERPDVFTQTVAAIPARGAVEVTLVFDTLARYQDGQWELVLPLVVAPRYVPGLATNRPTTGVGRAPDTDRSPDASRVTPGGAPGAGGATKVTLHFDDKPSDVKSPTHEIKVAGKDATFVDPKTDHDAIVRWRSPVPASGWVEPAPDGGYAAVVVQAPAATPRKGTLRCLLVVDRSAAARGDADATARPIVRSLLGALGAGDRVAVAGSDQIAWSAPADVARALEQRWEQPASAFDLSRVLQAARPDGAPIVLVTGGLVADDRAAIAAATKLGVPVHVIGVGPAPARALLVQIAAATGGTVRFAVPGDDLAAHAKAALADAASPPAPLTVTWGTLVASEVVPGALPRLGAGQAMIVLARVKRAQPANARARGDLFAIEVVTPRKLDGATSTMGPLARRWARNRLEEMISAKQSARAITDHALKYGLVSPYTSLVALGDEVVVQGGVKRSVAVPVSVPAGMKWNAVKRQTTVADAGPREKDKARDAKQDRAIDARTKTRREPVKEPVNEPVKKAEAKPDPKPTLDRDYTRNIPRPGGATAPPPPAEPPPPPSGGETVTIEPTAPTIDPGSTASEDEADDEAGTMDVPGRTMSAALGSYSEEIYAVESTGARRRWRIVPSLGGGFARSDGETASLLTAGARLELRLLPRTYVGVDGALWLLDGEEVAGQALLSLSRFGIARRFELGAGAGVFVGAGTGPAGSVSLRYHTPPAPRAAVYLRFDGALVTDEDIRRGQGSLTLGVELGF